MLDIYLIGLFAVSSLDSTHTHTHTYILHVKETACPCVFQCSFLGASRNGAYLWPSDGCRRIWRSSRSANQSRTPYLPLVLLWSGLLVHLESYGHRQWIMGDASRGDHISRYTKKKKRSSLSWTGGGVTTKRAIWHQPRQTNRSEHDTGEWARAHSAWVTCSSVSEEPAYGHAINQLCMACLFVMEVVVKEVIGLLVPSRSRLNPR